MWGCGDIDRMFPGGGLRSTTPWPRGDKSKQGCTWDRAFVEHLLRSPVELVDVDPRGLRCSQPAVLRGHVSYYLTGRWEVTGRTSADELQEHNRFPVIVRNFDGHDLILSGHHRSAAALLEGRPVRVRAIAAESAFSVTPLLRVGLDGALTESDAAEAIRNGALAAVVSLDVAAAVLRRLGATEGEASAAVELARRRIRPA